MLNANPTLSRIKTIPQFNFKFGFLLPWTFRFLGALAVIGSIPLMLDHVLIGVSLLLIGLLMVFVYEGFEIDPNKKVYREYTSFLLFKSGKFIGYDNIEKLYINKKHEAQSMYSAHTSKSTVFTNDVFNAYLKFSSGEKIHLLSKKNKERLLKRVEDFTSALSIPIIDNSL